MSKKSFIEESEEGAIEGVKAMRAFLAYQGDNPMYERKARTGAALAGSYTRHFASLTNRELLKAASARRVGKSELPSGD